MERTSLMNISERYINVYVYNSDTLEKYLLSSLNCVFIFGLSTICIRVFKLTTSKLFIKKKKLNEQSK